MSKKQIFRGKEIDAILGAAARLQEKDANANLADVGLSLEEIESIAAESGIDPEYVRRAALVRESGDNTSDRFHLFGGPAVLRRKLTLNRKLSKMEMERLVSTFRRITDNEGRVDSLHDSLTWHTNDQRENRGTSVLLESVGDQTLCSLRTTLWLPGFLIHYIPLILTLLISLPIGGSDAFSSTAIAIKIGIMGMVFMLTRYAYGALTKKRESQLDDIVTAIEALAMSSESSEEGERDQSSSSSKASDTIELPDESEYTDQQSTRSPSNRSRT